VFVNLKEKSFFLVDSDCQKHVTSLCHKIKVHTKNMVNCMWCQIWVL